MPESCLPASFPRFEPRFTLKTPDWELSLLLMMSLELLIPAALTWRAVEERWRRPGAAVDTCAAEEAEVVVAEWPRRWVRRPSLVDDRSPPPLARRLSLLLLPPPLMPTPSPISLSSKVERASAPKWWEWLEAVVEKRGPVLKNSKQFTNDIFSPTYWRAPFERVREIYR